jgi:hypothetical protein
MLLIGAQAALANLLLSGFDAGDGNLVVDNETTDWANVGIDCVSNPHVGCGLDKPTGATDDSFGQGTKEDDAVPTVVDGSIPNNKSDLLRFYVANNKENGKDFLYLAWERVQEPNGTTNMDFEFNQSATPSANGITPVRTAGDVLVKYDLSQGGTNPTLGYHKWITSGSAADCEASNKLPCWDKVHALSGFFEGAVNTAPVDDPINPGATRSLSARTFGEAAINLTDSGILPGGGTTCTGFGSAYLKSRSSDAFTSAVKDFIAPIPVNISNCGKILVKKITNPAGDAQSFSFTLTGGPDSLSQSFELKDAETHDSGQIKAGSGYVVAEPGETGWVNTSATCDDGSLVTNVDVSVGETVTCTFTNTKTPKLTIVKVTDPTTDTGKFNLSINGVQYATDVGNNGTTGAQDAIIGANTFGEAAGTGTLLSNYTSSVSGTGCGGSATAGTITLAAGDNKTCTITNTRKPTLTVTKVLVPSSDTGKFDLKIDGTTYKTDAGNGGSTGAQIVSIGSHAVSEGAGTGTALGDYTTVIGGDCAADGSVTLAAGDNKTCTITNTRRNFTVIVLVCEGSSLYSSSVTMNAVVTSSLGGSTTPTDAQLCALLGARYPGLLSGNQADIDIDIGLTELP